MSGPGAVEMKTQESLPLAMGGQDRPGESIRRYGIDWVRVLMMLGVFFFHNARFFDPLPWHVKNAERTVVAYVFVGFLNCFQMPLLMLVSGAGSWFALRSRNGGRYLWDRVLRLLVPLYTVGLLVLIPPQYYWELVTNKGYAGSFWQYIPEFLRTFSFSPDLRFLSFWPGHLWFLRDLFLISLLTLPLLLLLRSESGRRMTSRLAGVCDRWGGVFWFLVPIAGLQLGLRMIWPGGHPLIWFIYLLSYFVIGYLLMAEDRFVGMLQRHILVSLILGVASFLSMAYWVLGAGYQPSEVNAFSAKYALWLTLDAFNGWMWVVLWLGLAGRYLRFNHKALAYANEAVLPFYVLHQTVILAIGWFVVQWRVGMVGKYLIISVASFVAIMGVYELLIRRVNILRLIFGMRTVGSRS